MSSRRVDHTKTVRQWSDEEKKKMQQWLDQPTAPPPTRAEVLGAFPELWEQVRKSKPKSKSTDDAPS